MDANADGGEGLSSAARKRAELKRPRALRSQATLPSSPVATSSLPPATLIIVVGLLYFGRDILIPLALAGLLSFVMAPVVLWLRRIYLPRAPAVGVTVLLAVIVVGGLTTAIAAQLVQLAENLPTYQRNIVTKVENLQSMMPVGETFKRALSSLRDLEREVMPNATKSQPSNERRLDPQVEPDPVPVVVQSGPSQPIQLLRQFALPLLGPLGTAGLVLLFVIFILIEREELRDRFIKLVGGDDLQRSTGLITDGANRVSSYLLMTLVVNVTYGVPVGIGLAVIGVPNAILWGLLAIVLRFVPYLGPWLAALFPIVIAFGSEPGWSMVLWTIALFLVLELISNNLVEPWLYGESTGLSPFAIILAAIFWTVLWGPAGLVISTPLTACIVALGRYVPQLAFLDVLLGNEPVLSPAEQFYQRLIAGNVVEAFEQAERHIVDGKSDEFFEDVALEALRLAERDRQRFGDGQYRQHVASGVLEVVEDVMQNLADTGELKVVDTKQHDLKRDEASDGETKRDGVGAQTPSDAAVVRPKVFCIAGRSNLDHAAARILAFRLEAIGYQAEALEPMALAPHALGQIDLHEAGVVCLCYMSAHPRAYVRFACRRIERLAPKVRKIVCLWNIDPESDELGELMRQCGPGSITVTSLNGAIEQVAVPVTVSPSAATTA